MFSRADAAHTAHAADVYLQLSRPPTLKQRTRKCSSTIRQIVLITEFWHAESA